MSISLYHVTELTNVPIILRDGFIANEAIKGAVGIETYRFPSGVWLADVPPITRLSMDQYMGHTDEGWIEVTATPEFYQQHMVGNEWNDASWPLRQWLVPADAVNQLVRREVSLTQVLRMRLANNTTEHHRYVTVDALQTKIEWEMDMDEKNAVRQRWQTALDDASRGEPSEPKE